MLAGVTALDPFGFAPAGPLRATVVTVLVLVAAAAAVRTAVLPRSLVVAWGAFLLVLLLASALAVDPLHAWLGTPDRRMGWLSWVLCAAACVAGAGLAGRAEGCWIARAAAVASGVLGVWAAVELAAGTAFAAGRAGGPYLQPAYLGAACTLLVPVAIGLAATRSERLGWRVAAGAGAALGTFALLASGTRGAWVGAAVAALLFLPRMVGWTARAAGRGATGGLRVAGMRWGLLAAFVGALVVVAVVTPVGARALSAFGQGISSRGDEWRVGVAALLERPWVGYGPEGYRVVWAGALDAAYVERHGRDVLADRAHSGPLDVALAGGLPSLLAYAVLLALAVRAAWRSRRGEPWLAGCAAGVVGYLAQQLFLFPLLELDPLLWMLVGLLAGSTASAPGSQTARRVTAAALALAAVLALGAGLLDVASDHALRRATELDGPFDHDAAVAAAARATRLRPDSVRAWFVAARVAHQGGTIHAVDAALEAVEAGLAWSPRDPALREERARLLLDRAVRSGVPEDTAAAVAALEELTAADPHHPALRELLDQARELAGNLPAGSGV